MKSVQISIESFESVSNSYEAFMSYEYRECFGERFYELVSEIELIQKKLGMTIKSFEYVSYFHEDELTNEHCNMMK